MTGGVSHPLADSIGGGFVVTESRAPVIFLTAARVNLLTSARDAGSDVILVTDERSALTPAFAEVWRAAGATWVVRSVDRSLRDGFSGRRLTDLADSLSRRRVAELDEVAVDFLRAEPSTSLELLVNVSVRHRARATTTIGGVAEEVAMLANGRPPALWGAHEPTGTLWDRAALTSYARALMPRDAFVVTTGEGFTATLTARRTSEGIEEITQAHVALGTPSTLEFETQRAAAVSMLGRVAATSMPLVGLVMARPARRDSLIAPVLQHPPVPLALLIGPPGVKSLGLSVRAMGERFGAAIVGKPRVPGLLFELGTMGEATWQRLDDILSAIDTAALTEVFGSQSTTLLNAAQREPSQSGPIGRGRHGK